MSSKRCFKCEQVLPHGEFYRHGQMGDGLLGKCKECTKKDVRENYAANRERFKEYDRSRAMLPHRVAARQAYQSTQEGRLAMSRAKGKWQQRNPEKRAAHNAVNNAVRSGQVEKPDCCEICGVNARIHGHHDDYSKPLDVQWVCAACHTEIHKNHDQRQAG